MSLSFIISVSELQTALANLPKLEDLPKDFRTEIQLGPFLFKFDYSHVAREWEIYNIVKTGWTINE
jgi:hypothetical protein